MAIGTLLLVAALRQRRRASRPPACSTPSSPPPPPCRSPGLVVTDTATHWSAFGEVVILVLVQLGGFGIMTLSSLVALVLSRGSGLRRRQVAQAETSSLNPGDVRRVRDRRRRGQRHRRGRHRRWC